MFATDGKIASGFGPMERSVGKCFMKTGRSMTIAVMTKALSSHE
jgi:hypothetical protein